VVDNIAYSHHRSQQARRRRQQPAPSKAKRPGRQAAAQASKPRSALLRLSLSEATRTCA
jgi:hypothetical protein